MKRWKLFPIIFILTIWDTSAHSKVYLTKKEALKRAFPKATRIHRKIIWFIKEREIKKIERQARQQLRIKRISVYMGKKENHLLGYAFIDNVIGKKEFITYMVVINPAGRVKKVEIMVFRESQGWEVLDKVWRKQFTGKRIQDPIQLGKDIVNISGATLSCRSLAKGVRKILAIFQVTILKK